MYARCDFYVKQFLDFTCTENLNYIRKRVGSIIEELVSPHAIGKEWNKIRKKNKSSAIYVQSTHNASGNEITEKFE